MKNKKEVIKRTLKKLEKMRKDYDILGNYIIDLGLYIKLQNEYHKILETLCNLQGKIEDFDLWGE